jgi:hypothetical protein
VEERRRSVRRRVDGQVETLRSAHSVRVADISTSGVLLLSSRRVVPGARGRLRFNMGPTPFVADIEVMRVAAAPGPDAPYRIGAAFVGIDQEQHELIARFTRYD